MIGFILSSPNPITGKLVFSATSAINSPVDVGAYYPGEMDILPLILSTAVGDNFKLILSNGNYIKYTISEQGSSGAGSYKRVEADLYFANNTALVQNIHTSVYYTGNDNVRVVHAYPGVLSPITATSINDITKFTPLSRILANGKMQDLASPIASEDLNNFRLFFNGATPVVFFPGEISGGGGGTGSFDTTSDAIDFPSPPTLSAVTAGFITLFAPSISQLNSLASYMWSSAFDIDTFKKLFADPMDTIIGLSIVPVAVPVSGSASVKIGFIDTGVSMNLASSQYATINCGTLTPDEYWGSALDYSPYTKFSIYLPYIGTRELNTDDIMGKTLQVVYNIDILSGACTAMIKCGSSVLYEFSGACATSIPVTGQNWTQLITSCIQLAGAGIAVAASGGSAAGLLPSTANAVTAMKPNIQRTGAVSGSAGMLGVQQPYLIWELPRQSLAGDYNKFVGYPSNITALLSTLTGYTQIESIHLENIPATQSELAEIETLLKEGVII